MFFLIGSLVGDFDHKYAWVQVVTKELVQMKLKIQKELKETDLGNRECLSIFLIFAHF